MLRHLTPRMDRLIAVSRSIVEKLSREGGPGAPVDLIYNGVDLERYDHQEPCCTLGGDRLRARTPLVGVVARLEPEKGHPTLLEAWPRVLARGSRARLLVVGEGSRRESLEDQARSLGLLGTRARAGGNDGAPGRALSVVFTGRRDDVPRSSPRSTSRCCPRTAKRRASTILEAMALSRPVVASSVGGIPEVVQHGRTGLLVPPRDPDALADAIVAPAHRPPAAPTCSAAPATTWSTSASASRASS